MKKIFNLFNSSLKDPVLFWGASMMANVFNWIFNLQAGRMLTKEDFATLSVFISLQYLSTVPANALSTTVSRFTAFYSQKGEREKHFFFFRQYWWLAWCLGILFLTSFIFFKDSIQTFFAIDSQNLIILFSLLLIPLFLLAFEKGTLSGQFAFIWLGILVIVEALTKLLILLFGSSLGVSNLNLAVLALPLSIIAAWFIGLIITRSYHPLPIGKIKNQFKENESKETYQFLSNSFFAGLGVVLIYSLDILLIKHYFPSNEAGIFSTLSLLGKMLFFGAGSLIGLLIPLTARDLAKNLSGRKPFLILLSVVTTIGISVWMAYLLIPEIVIRLLLTERGFVAIPYLAKYSLAMLFLVIAVCFSTYNLAKKNYLPSRLIIVAAVIEAVLIIFFHNSLHQVVDLILITMTTLFVSIVLVDILKINLKSVSTNILSFADLFLPQSSYPSINLKTKNILIFNWRDLKHVDAGGAEVYIHELVRNLKKYGYNITIFTSNDGQSKSYENTNGIQIIRRGGFMTVYLWAFIYYILKFRGKYDLIIDCENGIPFFTPVYVRKPVILLIHHIHQDVFFKSLIPPFSWIANFAESILMPLTYRKSSVVAISNSTASEISNELGLTVTKIIPCGVDVDSYLPVRKSIHPQILYLGRLKKYKSIEILFLAFEKISQEFPKAILIIAGDGDYRNFLEYQAGQLNLKDKVKFLGKVTERAKKKILATSWVMVNPSYMEGWGITCIEANACGTPVIASNVSGLKDAVSDGRSGFLFEYGNHMELYQKVRELFLDQKKRLTLNKSAREWSKKFSWDIQAEKFNVLIEEISEKNTKSSYINIELLGYLRKRFS